MLKNLGFVRILSFDTLPLEIFFHPERSLILSIGRLNGKYWLKASKIFYIKAMETKEGTGIYSRLQNITRFMGYLKQNLPSFHCMMYYLSDITPRIAMESFRDVEKYSQKLAEYERIRKQVGEEEKERKMLFLKKIGMHDVVVERMEEMLLKKEEMRRRMKRLEDELREATGILNEWVEKGYGLALLWNVSTDIHVCDEDFLPKTLDEILVELKRIEDLSVRARAYQLGLWIEEVKMRSFPSIC